MSDTESIAGSEEVASPEENIVGERLRGDGQENQDTAAKKVDDDEDRRNPQYIPKRGNFYEHDDRTAEDVEENPEANDKQNEKDNPRSKKQVWEENGDKWQHDLYIDDDQMPKSKDELIEVYGYDIRNEDGPPRARRRRRYGRGPNKYTRNWEDEEAYTRPINQTPRRKSNPKQPPGKEEFPPLVPGKTDRINSKNNDSSLITEESLPSTPEQQLVFQAATVINNKGANETPKSAHPVASNAKTDYSKPSEKVQKRSFRNSSPIRKEQFSRSNTQVKNVKQQQNYDQRQQRSDSRPNRNSDQISNTRNMPQETRSVKIPPITSQSFTNTNRAKHQQQADVYDINKEMSTLKINESHTSQNSNGYNRQATVPPRLQNEQRAGGPKRYSSLRQRSLPETTQPTYAGPQQINASYYPQEYTQQQNLEGNLLPPHPHSSASTLISHNQELPPQQPILSTETPQTLLVTHGGQPQPMLTQAGNIPGLGHTVTHSGQVQPMMTQAGIGLPHSAQHQPILTQAGPILSQNGLPHAPNQGQSLLPPNQAILPQGQPLLPPQHGHPAGQGQPLLPQGGLPHPGNQGQPLAGLPQHPPQPQILSQDVVLCESHPGQFAQYQAQSAAYLQQSVTGPPQQFIPQQQPVINYAAASQPQFVPQPQPGAYPAFQPAYNPTTSTQDLYQPQGGITYYSPHTQQSVSRPPQKRPKAAIPILAPPEKSSFRGRGRNNSPTELSETPKSRGRGRIPLEENNSEPNFNKSTATGDTLENLSPNEDKLDPDQSELPNKSDQVFENAPENIQDEDIKIVPEPESITDIVAEKQKIVDATSNDVSENANTDQLDVKTNLSEEQLDTTITSFESTTEDSKDDLKDGNSE